jgi:hypothetical protein
MTESRLDAMTAKYQQQLSELDAGRRSLAALEAEEAALSEMVTKEASRIRKMKEQGQFGRVDYPADVQATDAAALQAERQRLEALQLDAGRLRRLVREQSMTVRQTGSALIREQRRTAGPLLHARRDGLIEEISELLPQLAAVLAITAQEPAELFSGPSRTLTALERSIRDRAAFREEVHRYYAAAMRAVGVDVDVEH